MTSQNSQNIGTIAFGELLDVKATLARVERARVELEGVPDDELARIYSAPAHAERTRRAASRAGLTVPAFEQRERERAELAAIRKERREAIAGLGLAAEVEQQIVADGTLLATSAIAAVKAWAADLDHGGKRGLWLHGGTGRGKTVAAAFAALHLGTVPVVLKGSTFFRRLRPWSMEVEARDGPLVTWKSSRLIVLDDLGSLESRHEERDQRFGPALLEIIENRASTGLLIITSNVPPSVVSKRYGPRVASRLNEFVRSVRCDGADLRGSEGGF